MIRSLSPTRLQTEEKGAQMALSHKAKKRWSLVILLVGLPVYIVVCLNVISLFDRPPFLVELLVFLVLGILWALPFKFVFQGVGQMDPEAED